MESLFTAIQSCGLTKPPLADASILRRILEQDEVQADFISLVCGISERLQEECNLEERVHDVVEVDDLSMFLLELNSLLKELKCPHASLLDQSSTDKFASKETKYVLINFLVAELESARMVKMVQEERNRLGLKKIDNSDQTNLQSLNVVKQLLRSFQFSKPPINVGAAEIFQKLAEKVQKSISQSSVDKLGTPLLLGNLTAEEWKAIEKINDKMNVDYKLRREMLHKRLDVTFNSFLWSSRVKKRQDEMLKIYQPVRKALHNDSRVTLAHLLAARNDLLIVEKLSGLSTTSATKSRLTKLLISGKVPDRGGRMDEVEPPPPEMPSWSKRVPGDRGGRGRDRGRGRVQGGWSRRGDRR